MPAFGSFLHGRQRFAELLQMQLLLTELFDVGGTVGVLTLAPAGFGDKVDEAKTWRGHKRLKAWHQVRAVVAAGLTLPHVLGSARKFPGQGGDCLVVIAEILHPNLDLEAVPLAAFAEAVIIVEAGLVGIAVQQKLPGDQT
mmetsp:Transcript_35862/g.54390  ORF Transcript_35862/g.54390 Transcript_35862/m.54390 type:complete len:141 (-) Transcript_35862:634-1056(-)